MVKTPAPSVRPKRSSLCSLDTFNVIDAAVLGFITLVPGTLRNDFSSPYSCFDRFAAGGVSGGPTSRFLSTSADLRTLDE